MSSISAVLLSWKRQAALPGILESLRQWPRIGEVILWNNNPDVPIEMPEVTVINSPQNYLGLARYCAAPLARFDTIWFQDDDLLFQPQQLEQIYDAYDRDRSRIYGGRGRNIIDGRYRFDDVRGDCDIVLGQSMLFHRSLLANFFRVAAGLPRVAVDYGDDIIFSLSCGRRHFAVDVGHVKEDGWDDEVALWRRPDHFERRQDVVDLILGAGAKMPATTVSDGRA